MNTKYVKGEAVFLKKNQGFKQYPYLNKNITCDVLIIGGGVTGAITGYYMSKDNVNTVIIEKSRIAHGSTSITTSLLQYELDSNASELKEYTSESNIVKSYQLGLFALDEIDKFIKSYKNQCEFKRTDSLLYTAKNNEKQQIINEYNFRKSNGFDVKLIDENNHIFDFDLKQGIISCNGAAVLDPYKYTHSLIECSLNNGMQIFENTEAVKILYENDKVKVITQYDYEISCKKVIIATGYNTKMFTKRNFATKYTTFNIASKRLEKIPEYLNNFVIRDNNDPYHYFRATSDNRILLGGEDINFIPDIDNDKLCNKSYNNLENMMNNIFNKYSPQTEYKYCGCFATTKDNLGFIGEDPDNKNMWYCLGYGANGILFAILGGVFLSKLYKGETDKNINLFKVDRYDN